MIKKEYLVIILMSFIAGLVGGGLSNQLFITKFAFAQKDGSQVKIIDAQQFRVVDMSGKPRAILGYTPDLSSLFSEKEISKWPKEFRDVLQSKGGPALLLLDDKEAYTPLASIGLTSDGSPQLLLRGKDEKKNILTTDYLQLTTEEPTLFRFVKGGVHRIVFGLDNEGSPHLFLADKDEKPIWKAP